MDRESIDEIRAKLLPLRTVPQVGQEKKIVSSYNTGVVLSITNDGQSVIIKIKNGKTSSFINVARVYYKGNLAEVNNADRALTKAIKKTEMKLSSYKI